MENVRILDIFFYPPLAVGRLGGSPTPLENYIWDEDPTIAGAARTVIQPITTLDIAEDGSLQPYLPAHIRFRDGTLYRPVAPFFELWAGFSTPEHPNRQEAPLTPDLLDAAGASTAHLAYLVTAANLKAARRCGDPACGYQAELRVLGNDHTRHRLLAASPRQPRSEPLVNPDQPIPLGFFQVIRPIPVSEMGIDLSRVRVRFTPAGGEVYGPPSAIAGPAPGTLRTHLIVKPENRILNPRASWLQYNADYARFRNPEPSDTYDGADVDPNGLNPSWGVVDDTCDAIIQADLVVGGERFQARGRVFVGPPHFAPDRRPFLSLADDLADRDPPVLDTQETLEEAEKRVNDLFQRALETAGLINLDAIRRRAIGDNGPNPPQVAGLPRTDDASMTAADAPYADLSTAPAQSVPHARLPLTDLIQRAHGQLADLDTMVAKFREQADRIRQMIRPPFAKVRELDPQPGDTPAADHRDPRIARDLMHDMRMPPYMRDSEGLALSVTHRQYQEIMSLLNTLQTAKEKVVMALRAANMDIRQFVPPETPIRRRVRSFLRQHQGTQPTTGGALEAGNRPAEKPESKPRKKSRRGS